MIDAGFVNLKVALKKSLEHESSDTVNIINRIHSYCLCEFNFPRLSSILNELFENEPKLLDIYSNNENKVYQIFIENFCDFIINLVKFAKEKLLPFCGLIKNYLLNIVKSKKSSAKMKELSIKSLQHILTLTGNNNFEMNIGVCLSDLFSQLQNKSSATVLASLIELIGKICLLYPNSFTHYSSEYEGIALNLLQKEINNSKTSIISGCCEGLRRFYNAIPEKLSEKSPPTIYPLLLKILHMDSGYRFAAVKSCLHFLSDHWANLKYDIFGDTKQIFPCILKHINHNNAALKFSAQTCLDKYLAFIGEQVQIRFTNDSLSSHEKDAFNYIFDRFHVNLKTIQSLQNHFTDKCFDTDIKGLGQLVKGCSILLPKETLGILYSIIGDYVWKEYLLEKDQEQSRSVLPRYKIYPMADTIISITMIVDALCSSKQFEILQYPRKYDIITRLTCVFIEFSPRLTDEKMYLYRRIFDAISENLKVHETVRISIFEKIIYQTIILSCSFPVPPDFSIIQDFSLNISDSENCLHTASNEIDLIKSYAALSIRDFLPFWNAILQSDDGNYESSVLVFDNFLKSTFKIIDQLDLLYQPKNVNSEKINTDPMIGQSASTPKDFVVFVNLSQLFQFVLKYGNENKIKNWASFCLNHLISRCLELPLVSGFYKMIGSIIKLLNSFGFFEPSLENNDRESLKDTILYDIKILIRSMLEKICNYNDELLITCLTLLVNSPVFIWIGEPDDNAFNQKGLAYLQMAIQLGNCYLPLGQACLDMLERWIQALPRMEGWVKLILPSYRTLLLFSPMSSDVEYDVNQKQLQEMATTKRSSRKLARTLRYMQIIEQQRSFETIENEINENNSLNNLEKLQNRLIRILGSMGIDHSRYFIRDNSGYLSDDVHWNKSYEPVIIYELPFKDIKPGIRLEWLITPISSLALNSTNNQVKSLASEVLHSLIIILLGKSATTILPIEKIKFIPTWSFIFNITIKLATNMNKVSKTLFTDLLMQIAYWYSYPVNFENPAVECFIDCLFSTIIYIPTEDCSHEISIDPNSGNVQRDLAGQLLFHFLKSSFEHNHANSDILEKAKRKIKKFLRRIYFLCQNFSPYKRLGAVFIFNSIFPILKNEKSLMENEIFTMMYYLVECQQLSESDKHLGTIGQLKFAFKNIGNTVISLKSKLMEVSENRSLPPLWTAATIEFAIRWLLNHYLSDKRRLRQVCTELSEQLSFCYDENNPNSFFRALLTAKPLEYVSKKFESAELFKMPPNSVNVKCWMNTLEASVQSFCWLFSRNLIDFNSYFVTGGVSHLFNAVNNFLSLYKHTDPSKDLFQLSSNVICFFRLIFSSVNKLDFITNFVNINNLMKFFIDVTLEPSQIGLDVRNRKKVEKWLEKIKIFIKAMVPNIRLSFLDEIHTALSNYSLLNEINEISNSSGRCLNSFDVEYIFKFLKFLSLAFSDFNPLNHSTHEAIFEKILRATNYESNHVSPLKVHQSAVLDYILITENGFYFDKIISMLATTEMHSLLNAHREVLLKNLLLFSEKFVPHLQKENIAFLLPLLLDLLHYGIRNNLTEKKSIVQVLVDNWFKIDPFSYSDLEVNQENLNLTIDLLLEMMLINPEICESNPIFEFFCNLLSSSNLLITVKNKIIPALTHFFKYAAQSESSSMKIVENIKIFFDKNFLALSKDLRSDLSLEECYFNSISAVFNCLQIPCRTETTCLLIKIILIPIFCREHIHPLDDNLNKNLELLCERLASDERIKLLSVLDDELKLIKTFENIIWFLNKFYFVIILKCDFQNLNDFFGSKIYELTENIKLNNFENLNEMQLQNVLINLEIISTIYKSLGPFSNQEKVCLRESKLIGDLSKICSLILYDKSSNSANKLMNETIYNIRARAFNCFSSVVIATQSDEKFYANLLLRYNKPLFLHIIYQGYALNFPSEILIYKMKQTKFYTLDKSKPTKSSYSTSKKNCEPIHSVAEFLSDSSLALDVDKLENILNRNINSNLMDSDSFVQNDGRCLIIVNIPDDIVNNHPCMDTFICLYHQMKNVGIISEAYSLSNVPLWMKVTHDTFFSQDVYIDIKYFIIKLIINCHDIFKPYASFWVTGFIEFLISNMSSINPFVESVLRLLIDWSSVQRVYDIVSKANINLLINWLAENCYSDNPSIVRTNIELFFSLLNLWKGKVDIPYKPIFDNLQNTNKGLRNCCGLKMLAAVLNNGYLFMAGANNDTKFGFIKQLVKILQSKLKTVFGPAFELCGILIKQLLKDSDSKSEWILEIEKEITLTFETVLSRSKSDFLTCLALIGKNHTDIIWPQISNLILILKSLTDDDYCKALELLGCGMRDSNEWLSLFTQLYEWNIFENIQYKPNSVIRALIKLFHQVIVNIQEWKTNSQINANVVKCFEICLSCSTHDEKDVRALFFQLFIDLSSEKQDILFKDCFQSALLMGFIDPDKEISQSIRNFCSSSQCLPTETLERSCKILEILFPESNSMISVNKFLNRSKFLAIATNIVLEMTSHSPDFIRPIFLNQLDITTTFENLTAARMNSQTTRSLLPNFVNIKPELLSYSKSHDQMFKIPTAMNIPKQAKNFDWIQLTSTLQFPSQEVDENQYEDNYSMEWSSSQIPGVDMSLSIKSQKSFLNPTASPSNIEYEDETRDQTDFQTCKTSETNFTKELDSDYFREKAVQKQKLLIKKHKIEKNIKKSAVYLYRNHHIGKLPNIKLQNCSFIGPLQMLGQLNEEFSKDLFCHLYNGLLKEGQYFPHSGGFEDFCKKLSQNFDNILKTCGITDKHLISSCLQIAIDNISKINLTPSFVYNASNVSGNEVLATILLEKYLIRYLNSPKIDSNEIPPIKKQKLSETENDISLVSYLMKLYKVLNLNEEIIGLLQIEQLSSSNSLAETFREALEADCFGNYKLSYDLYNSLLSKASLDENNDFEYELLSVSQTGLMHSLRKLCKWTELTTFLNGMIDETLSSQDFKIAESMVNSKLRTLVFDKDVDERKTISELDELLKQFQTSISNYELLMPTEISLYYILKEDYNKAQRFCEMSYDKILANCRDYSLSRETNTLMLQSLHLLNEMSEFLSSIQKCDMSIECVKKLKENYGDLENDSLEFWENLLFYRTIYLKKFLVKLPFFAEAISAEISDLQMQFIDACIFHNRIIPALSYLKSSKRKFFQGDNNSKFAWCLKYCRAHLRSAFCHGSFVSCIEAPDILNGLTNSVKLLLKFPTTDVSSTWEYLLSLGDCYWTIGNVLSLYWQSQPEDKTISSILELIDNTENCSKDSLICSLFNKSFYCFNKIISLYTESESDQNRKQFSTALMVVSDFYDAQIRQFENDGSSQPDIIRNYVESTLYSMKLEQFSAKNKFPRLLQIINQYSSDVLDFSSFTVIFSSIPSWMYIPWLDQMIPFLDCNISHIVESIISRIADEYPHALFYPFMLYVADVTTKSNFTCKIGKILSTLSLVHQFYAALLQMGQPEYYLQEWLDEVNDMFSSNSHDSDSRRHIVNKYQNMYRKVIGDFDQQQPGFYLKQKKSQFQEEFSKLFEAYIKEKFREDGTSIYTLTQNEFFEIRKKICNQLNTWKSKVSEFKSLKDFSPWLAKYNFRDIYHQPGVGNQCWLEIPGQYNNITTRPFPEKHVKIFKFDSGIQIIPSKQCPKKIIIIGDNEQHYSFLVKSGEDLRQDYRIEQMFSVMNDILSRDYQLTTCLKTPLFIKTYNVIPISKSLGLLEWIDNTVTLSDFYRKTMNDEENFIYKKIYSEFYSRYFPDATAYNKSWEKPDVVSTNREFEENQKLISNFDLLRKSFMSISKSHESFYRLRINFIQQYAMTAGAHYLLGIGDRHLKNFLINENTGDIIGIDFGYAFGIATIFLQIPELIPFRLTSSMMEFMKPAGTGGIFSQTLDNVLSTLGREQLTIISIMHVFLTNQIIDWHRMSKMSKQSIESFTQKRINISHRKLKREDPLLLLYEELQIKYGNSNWFRCMKRFQSEEEEKSQTKKLVSMATNSGFLARTWRGFEPLL